MRSASSILIAFVLCGAAPRDGWKQYEQAKGATFEHRSVEGSGYPEIRATIDLSAKPESAAAFIWSFATDPASTKTVRKRVIRQAPDEMIIYQQMFLPAVSDRDVTLRLWKLPPAEDGTLEMRWESANDKGPAPDKDFVRMTAVRGSWAVKPLPDGKVRIIFLTHSEPGGTVPAVFVRSPQRDRAGVDFWNVVNQLAKP